MRRFIYIVFVTFAISACVPVNVFKNINTTPSPQPPSMLTPIRSDLTWEQSLLVSQLSSQLGYPVDDIIVAETTAVTWQDDCMDVQQTDRTCTQGEIPGYRFILVANDRQYEYHTNKDMTEILLVEDK